MILNIKHQANWEIICQNKQKKIDENNKRENSTRIPHIYNVGDRVLLKRGTENKYETPYEGPYPVIKVYDNGTVCLKIKSMIDTVNIRRLIPFKEPTGQDHGGECSMQDTR